MKRKDLTDLVNKGFRQRITFHFSLDGVGRLPELIRQIRLGQLASVSPSIAELTQLQSGWPVIFFWRLAKYCQKITDTPITVETTNFTQTEELANLLAPWAIRGYEIEATDIPQKNVAKWHTTRHPKQEVNEL